MNLQAIGVRPSAAAAWTDLQAALIDAVVPCTADPESWTGEDPDDRETAARACLGCPARWPCELFATANRETHGVWAGVDRTGRRRNSGAA